MNEYSNNRLCNIWIKSHCVFFLRFFFKLFFLKIMTTSPNKFVFFANRRIKFGTLFNKIEELIVKIKFNL